MLALALLLESCAASSGATDQWTVAVPSRARRHSARLAGFKHESLPLIASIRGAMKTGDQPLEPPTAQFHRQVIGEAELLALCDGGINYPAAMIFGRVSPEGATRYNLPARQLFVPYTLLLVRRGRNAVLCDVGAGDLGNPGDQAFPGLDHSTSRTNLLVPSLLAAGMEPREVDTVLITHAHPDHVGGMLDAEGRLVFPNAHYYVARQEWDYWMSVDPAVVGARALREHLEQLIAIARKALHAIAERVTLVEGDEEVMSGIRFERALGHTPGHLMVTIAAGGQTIHNISDVVVHPLFLEHPEWAADIDMDAGLADEARRRFFARAAEEHTLVFGHHLGPFPNLGRIAKCGDAWQWQPVSWA
ncbi:MAG: MBL fold metallo-hydrolase [Planctomycetes bacterium]|nr:MBL fold metallo-hydrolase [Planctomycetota bacterium]